MKSNERFQVRRHKSVRLNVEASPFWQPQERGMVVCASLRSAASSAWLRKGLYSQIDDPGYTRGRTAQILGPEAKQGALAQLTEKMHQFQYLLLNLTL